MLILSRQRGQRIVLPGCSVTLTVIAIEGNRVRLGITAPAEVAVLRDELVRRKTDGGLDGTKSSTPATHG